MDENDFLNSIFPMLNQGSDIIVGPGDDCAVIDIGNTCKYLLIAADQIISGIHFDPNITTPEKAGAKLLKRNISDIAAMGGIPAYAVVTIASSNFNNEYLRKFYKGLSEEANKWDISICGGDIGSLPKYKIKDKDRKTINNNLLVTTLTIAGYVQKDKLCLRKNAKPGDIIFVTGEFGNSYSTEHHLDFVPRINEAGFIAGTYSDTMMDVSDGLLIDLLRIAKASKVTLKLDTERIPCRYGCQSTFEAMTNGEDYELIFTVSGLSGKSDELIKNWSFNTKLTPIGQVIEKVNDLDIVETPIESGVALQNQHYTDLIKKYNRIGWDHINK